MKRLMGVVRTCAVMLPLCAQCATSGKILVRSSQDVCRWQTVMDETAVRWRWPDGATKAVVTVIDRLVSSVAKNYEVGRVLPELWGSCVEALPSTKDSNEHLYDVVVAFQAGEEQLPEALSARVVALSRSVSVYPVALKEYAHVRASDIRLVPCAETGELSVTTADGERSTVMAEAPAGYVPLPFKGMFNEATTFTLALNDTQVSENLRYTLGGFVIFLK